MEASHEDECIRGIELAHARHGEAAGRCRHRGHRDLRAVNSPGRELKIFQLADGGAEHCGADNGSLIVDYIADWVAEKLGGAVAGV